MIESGHISEGSAAPPSWLRLSWRPRDQHRLVTIFAGLGLAIAVAMSVFGLPPVDLHGPFHQFGIMDPLCGGTRAARYTAQGEWALAWKYNPLGILTVLGAGVVTARTVIGMLTRRWLTAQLHWTLRRGRAVTVVVIGLLVALEIRQQLQADLLMAGT